jgi:hypothetical protein
VRVYYYDQSSQGWQIDSNGFWVFAKIPKTKNPKTCHLWVEFINTTEKWTKVAEIRQDFTRTSFPDLTVIKSIDT